jgi:AcrR family transcriptional regulator
MQNPDSPKYQQQKLAAIRAAASVFARKGFHGASTTDIASAMGIKQGSLYYYFQSTEEALAEVCLYGITDYVTRMEEIAASEQSFEARLLATVTSHLSSYREKNEALKVHNDERLYLPEIKRIKLKKLGSHYRQLLEHIFTDAVRKQELRPGLDCHFAAQSVIGLCNSWGELIVRDPGLDVFEVIRKCTDLLLNGFVDHSHSDDDHRRSPDNQPN